MKWNCAIKLQASWHYIFELQFMFVIAVYMRYKKEYKIYFVKKISKEFYDLMMEKTNSYNKYVKNLFHARQDDSWVISSFLRWSNKSYFITQYNKVVYCGGC